MEAKLARDISQGEKVEGEIDVFISRRHEKRIRDEGERAAQEMYEESCRRHSERERLELLWERLRYHHAMIRSHTANQGTEPPRPSSPGRSAAR